jgi:predicted nucleotidyltransferase
MNIQTIKHLAIPVLKKYGILRASLFGSAVRGEMNDSSDVDILVELPHDVHGYDYVALKVSLQEELESTLGKKVDVVEYNLIKPALNKYILPTQQQII